MGDIQLGTAEDSGIYCGFSSRRGKLFGNYIITSYVRNSGSFEIEFCLEYVNGCKPAMAAHQR